MIGWHMGVVEGHGLTGVVAVHTKRRFLYFIRTATMNCLKIAVEHRSVCIVMLTGHGLIAAPGVDTRRRFLNFFRIATTMIC